MMGHQIGKFTDNTWKPIIAIDFDGTITKENRFPEHGELRPYAKEVINLLHDLGVAVVIWTSRDAQYIDPLDVWLRDHGVRFNDINSSIAYAPFEYESRKIYAHMYVDDRGFGWQDTPNIMISVLRQFMTEIMGVDKPTVDYVCDMIESGCGWRIDIEQLKNNIHGWRMS